MIASSRSGKGRLLFYCRAAPTGKLTLPQSTRAVKTAPYELPLTGAL